MIWSRLKSMKCPECNSLLKGKVLEKMYGCTNEKCTFKISEERFNELVKDLYKPSKWKSDMDRASEWNNMGRDKVSEDFSDSKTLL